jgi:hypothetical protein
MDPVTLIVTALAASAATASQDGVSSAVKDAYARLTALVKKRFAGNPDRELVLARHESAPQVWDKPLATELTAAGVADDQAMVAAAHALMQLVDAAGSAAGKYQVVVHGSQGVQAGDHNIQHPDAPPKRQRGKPPHPVIPIGSRPAHTQEVHDA